MAANHDWIINLHKHKKESISVMDNLDLIIFSVIISVAFISFIVMTIREFNKMSKNPYQSRKNTDNPTN